MKLRELLQEMQATTKKIGSSTAYICGGTPRDRYLKHLENISDIDVTTGDKSIQYLSQEFGAVLGKKYNIVRKNFDDGHSAIHIGSFKMDFSSNFNVEGIEGMLQKMGIEKPTELQKEMFSRDFTCNSLLLSLDLKQLLDPTKRGFKDMEDKVIRTCLSPEVTLTSNKNRVIRAVYLAAKLGFDIDPSIIEFVQKNPQSVKISTEKSLSDKLNEAFKYDADRAAHFITKMGLWNEIPITESVQPYYMKKEQLVAKKAYFQGGGGVNEPTPKKKKYKSEPAIVNQTRFKEPFYRNYDLYDIPGFEHIGPGAGWHSMQKYKSVSEFLEAKRKKMKDKYKADDSWIDENGDITKKNPIKARAQLLSKIVKTAIDFPIDDQMKTPLDAHEDSIFQRLHLLEPDAETSSSLTHSTERGGHLALPEPNEDGKLPSQLDFSHLDPDGPVQTDEDLMDLISEKYLDHEARTEMYGLPDGFNHSEEEDVATDEINPDYGTLGPESLMYEDKWNI